MSMGLVKMVSRVTMTAALGSAFLVKSTTASMIASE